MTTSLQEDKFYSRNSFPFKVPHGVPKDNTIAIKKKKTYFHVIAVHR